MLFDLILTSSTFPSHNAHMCPKWVFFAFTPLDSYINLPVLSRIMPHLYVVISIQLWQ